MTFAARKGTAVGAPTAYALFPAEQVPPTHYLSPSSRDWYSWALR